MSTSTNGEARLLRQKDVCELVGLSRVTVWRYLKTGRFPKPVWPGGAGAFPRWRRSDVLAWIEGLEPSTKADAVKQ